MQIEQLKLFRLKNQFLLKPGGAEDVVSGLIGLQAQYGAQALHALAIRSCGGFDPDTFVKTWSFRGTLHLHLKSDLPLVLYRGSQTAFGQMAFLSERVEKARAEQFRALILDALEAKSTLAASRPFTFTVQTLFLVSNSNLKRYQRFGAAAV